MKTGGARPYRSTCRSMAVFKSSSSHSMTLGTTGAYNASNCSSRRMMLAALTTAQWNPRFSSSSRRAFMAARSPPSMIRTKIMSALA